VYILIAQELLIADNVCRGYKQARLMALMLVLKEFESVASVLRCTPSALTLACSAVYMINSLFYTPDLSPNMLEIVRRACWNRALDPEAPADIARREPVMYGNGIYFLCDIWFEGEPYRLGGGMRASQHVLAEALGQRNWSELCHAFGAVRTRAEVGTYHRVRNRRTQPTMTIEDRMWLEGDEAPSINFGLPSGRLTLAPHGRDTGRDVEAAQEFQVDSDDEMAAESRTPDDDGLSKLWLQFCKDAFATAPNPRRAHRAKYDTLTEEQREAASEAYFKKVTIQEFFTKIHARLYKKEEWTGMLFDNTFPPKSIVDNPPVTLQNKPTMTYYIQWTDMVARVQSTDGEDAVEVLRAALRKRFNELTWAPAVQADRFWRSATARGQSWIAMGGGGPAPWIAVNSGKVASLRDIGWIEEEPLGGGSGQ
jgi:hypothetical protein